jgi:hypothetical protein
MRFVPFLIWLVFSCVEPAQAQLIPAADVLLGDAGFSVDQIAQVEAGQLVRAEAPPSTPRELVAVFAFNVSTTPSVLVADAKAALLDRVDPNTSASQSITSGAPSDFAKLVLTDAHAARFRNAAPGSALNLSVQEIATFQQLGPNATTAAITMAVREMLAARFTAYRAKGLGGIAPYARSGGATRDAAAELRSALGASRVLQKYAPIAHRAMGDYPGSQPPGTQDSFRWSLFDAHGVPTIALTHRLFVPDGDAWVVMQRQFYVSAGYNSMEAVAAFLPAQGETVVVYAGRTSTDQVEGFGGSTRRSLGSRVLASRLESMFEKARAQVQ